MLLFTPPIYIKYRNSLKYFQTHIFVSKLANKDQYDQTRNEYIVVIHPTNKVCFGQPDLLNLFRGKEFKMNSLRDLLPSKMKHDRETRTCMNVFLLGFLIKPAHYITP